MSVYIDRSFLLRLSPKLQRFTQKKPDLYSFRCPLCGDSQKNKTKTRGYVYRKKNDYFFMCHNCGASTTFYNFLEQVDSSLLKEYALERYKDSATANNYIKPTFDEFKTPHPVFKEKLNIPSISSLPEGHFAKSYVIARKIPEKLHSDLYYSECFKTFVDDLGIEKEGLVNNDKRLVIPFYDENKNLIAFQGRSLTESKLRYITIKVDDDNKKVFGMDRIDTEKKIFVVEGPIDSLFLDNAVATADSNLTSIIDVYDKTKVVLVFDNEPRNKDICRMIDKAIENHYSVDIWPDMIVEKDVNDMILSGFSCDELQDIVEANTFVNLRAKMEFIAWKKV